MLSDQKDYGFTYLDIRLPARYSVFQTLDADGAISEAIGLERCKWCAFQQKVYKTA